ncbi:MAG: hypothetical protein AB1473_06550 [Thermodesulfobacteriota bacterium]
MTDYTQLAAEAKELATLLKPKQKHEIPSELILEAQQAVQVVIDRLTPLLPPTPRQKKRAKQDPISSQIHRFVASDSARKKFFNVAYFQERFRTLPQDRELIAAQPPTTPAAARDAVILYHYRAGKLDEGRSLSALQTSLERDYLTRPEVRELERKRALFRKLMATADLTVVARRLMHEFPDESSLRDFAKANKLKIPAQKRGKKAVIESAHDRLAKAIHERGAVARLEL